MIRKLAPHLVHQIAAGEVIERPASVLKELLENSLDAGASKISITYEAGGLKFLRIDDDGLGIPEAELPLAFEAHATSKLAKFEDFEGLQTFGFRGEALSSIAAMADVEIWTAAGSEARGCRGRVAFGAVKEMGAADKRIGSQITVRDLFSVHPARLKFMKSERGEAMQLLSVFKKYALAYPKHSFSLQDLETGRVHSVHSEDFIDRALWFFGDTERKHWMQIEKESSDWKIKAAVLRPRFHEKVRAGIHLYLDRRPFKDSRLEFAVKRAFEGFTLFPRDISAVIFLEGSPKLFDVNVHPMKTEVRFIQPEILFSFISRSITEALNTEHQDVSVPAEMSREPERPRSSELRSKPSEQLVARKVSYENLSAEPEAIPIQKSFSSEIFSEKPSFEFISSLDDTYLLCKKSEELYLFDQHALHERILYEALYKDFEKQNKIPSQRLLFPVPLQFSGAENLLEQEEFLEKLGFEVRQWQNDKLQLVAAPAILKRGYAEVLSKLSESSARSTETLVRDILSTMACHSAVRAHDRIDRAEVDRLLKAFESEDALGHCPHGRPTFIRLQIRDLEKMFHRVV
jgi:DNA mismatch repair protein MutL